VAKVGHIREIWRFPVKSMQGSTIESCKVSATGALGDRRWAMRDIERQEIQWGKLHPALMLCSASYRSEPGSDEIQQVDVTFPDGETVGSDEERIHQKLSDLVGRIAELWPVQPASNHEFYKRYKPDEETFMGEMAQVFAREPDEPMPDLSLFPEALMDYVSIPGTFFDNEELNFLTSASLAHMQSKNPQANWDVRRFRPNFLIETVNGLQGLVENDWQGKTVKIGSATLQITMPTPRCGMTVRPQGDIEFDKTILRTIVKEANQNLGVGAHCLESGEVCVGDTVEVLD
jgi:uncharacterized protein YcbX